MRIDWEIAFLCIAMGLFFVIMSGACSMNEANEDEIYSPAVGLAIMIYPETGTYEERGERVQRLSRLLDRVVIRELQHCPVESLETIFANASDEKLETWNTILKPIAQRLEEQRKTEPVPWCVLHKALGQT